MTAISFLFIFLASFVLTGVVRVFCLNFKIVDHPCSRRTNQKITPRGGGLAIVMVVLVTLISEHFSMYAYIALFPALLISLVAFWDDVRPLPARFRLSVQVICALMSIYFFANLSIVQKIIGLPIPMWGCLILSILFIVWSTNLYNFMDGVNGLAAIEALCFTGFMALLAFSDGYSTWGNFFLILGCATAGFLVWNFPHAKIFLGDTGSHFFGFLFSILLLKMATIHTSWFWAGLIILGYFIVDATLTLIVRVWNNYSFYEPHRTHAYQLFWKKWSGNHAMVTFFVLMLNLFWLLPWAWVVAQGYLPGILGLTFSYLPLCYLVWVSRAGRACHLGIDIQKA